MKRKSRERTGMFSHGRKNALRRLRAQAGWVGREKRDERREKASVYVPTNAPLNGHQNFTSAVGRRFGGDVVGGEYVVWPVRQEIFDYFAICRLTKPNQPDQSSPTHRSKVVFHCVNPSFQIPSVLVQRFYTCPD